MKDLHERWPHRWVNPKAKSGRSPLHELGVFAKEDIKKGEMICIFGGVIVPSSEIKDYWSKMSHVGIQIHEKFFMVPTDREELELTGVFNHSCDPNIGFLEDIQFVAIKDIKAGEELVFDYAFSESLMESFECKCNSNKCRKQITSNDWKIPEVQSKYKKYFSPYLRKKI